MLLFILDVKECSQIGVNCGPGRKCTEAFGGYECTCADSTKYGENCDKGKKSLLKLALFPSTPNCTMALALMTISFRKKVTE